MELREQIDGILRNLCGAFVPERLRNDAREQLLSLPSGMEKVKVCDHLKLDRMFFNRDITFDECPTCHGSGEIITDLTVGEAIEWTKNIIKFVQDHPFYERQPDTQLLVLNNSGERIRMRKEEKP